MILPVIGLLIASAVLIGAFLHSTTGWQTFLNLEAILIVIGGTLAILLMSTRSKQLSRLLAELRRVILRSSSTADVRELLLRCSASIEAGRIPQQVEHAFLAKSLDWLKAGLRGPGLHRLLSEAAQVELARKHRCSEILLNLSKYPPALGMVGTVFGIIAIFNGLGTSSGQESLGRDLAFAMTATLYGLVASNFFLNPLAELVEDAIAEEEIELAMIIETVKLWGEKESAALIREQVEIYDAA